MLATARATARRTTVLGRHMSTEVAAAQKLSGHYARFTPGTIASEQARAAVSGLVPSESEQGLSIATFAGGCFWGPQLLFERVPGERSASRLFWPVTSL